MKVVVIGAGLAGAVAAARLKQRGLEVSVVADRPGATILHGGGWYLGIKKLGRFGLAAPRIGEALDCVCEGLAELALEDGPFALPDADAVPRLVDLAPANHAAFDTFPERFAVAHLAPLGHPFAQMFAAHGATEVVEVNYPRWEGALDRSFAATAARFERKGEAEVLAEALKAACGDHEAVLLPPVLGLTKSDARRKALEEATGLRIAEALGALPSTPGLRLEGALRRWLERLEVPLHRARATRIQLDLGRVRTTGEGHDAEAVVLATGGFIPGGLVGHGPLREPLAGARVAPDLPMDLLRATNPDRPYGGALFRAGVPVDAHLRPIGYDGAPLHPRLYAVGDLLAGPDVVGDSCASGLALLSGYLAAEHLAMESG